MTAMSRMVALENLRTEGIFIMLKMAMANHKRPWRRTLDGRLVDGDDQQIDPAIVQQLLTECVQRIDYLEATLSDRKLVLRDQAAVSAISGTAAKLELEIGADSEDEDFMHVNDFALIQANDLVAKLYPPDQGEDANEGE